MQRCLVNIKRRWMSIEKRWSSSLGGFGRDPNAETIIDRLRACGRDRDLRKARALHAEIMERGYDARIAVANTVVDVYGKCGSLVDARRAFERIAHHSTVSWNVFLMAFVANGEDAMALDFFARMDRAPDARTFMAAVKACSGMASREEGAVVNGKLVKLAALERGASLHFEAGKKGFDRQKHVACSLITMYARCGSILDARRVFEAMEQRDLPAWNAMMLGYVDNGEADPCLDLFESMQEPVAPDGKKEEELASLEKCMALHARADASGFVSNIFVANTLIECYVRCGSVADAERVFQGIPRCDIVLCSSLMLGYVSSGDDAKALELFRCMDSKTDCQLDELAFTVAFKAVSGLAEKEDNQEQEVLKVSSLRQGRDLHTRARIILGVDSIQNSNFVANALIVMYAKCGSMTDAQGVFDKMTAPDMVSSTALMQGYVENGMGEKGLEVFSSLIQAQGSRRLLDMQTLVAALNASRSCTNLEATKSIFALACRLYGLESVDAVLAASLVDVFAKCGSIVHSQRLFDSMDFASKDVVAWNTLLAGYGRQGNSKLVLSFFQRMQAEARVKPDATTFVCLLMACSHAGLVDQATHYFELMSSKHGLVPGVEHYSCMVDALARANRLDSAVAMANSLEAGERGAVAWRSILNGCCKWKNSALGKLAAERLLKLDGRDAAALVLLGNVIGREE